MTLHVSLFKYAVGLAATFGGAWLTEATGSLLPLALGASATLMLTVPLVKAIWRRDKKRGDGAG